MPMIEATQSYRILTSRTSLLGADGLNSINTTPINQGALILVGDTLWRLNRTSTAVADGITVIAPITGPGRWHEVMAMGDELSVPDITALKALTVTSPTRVWVESVKCYWRRESSSPYTPDDITIAAAIGGGNWERITPTTVLDWCQQSDLYVNPTTGHDENPGTLAMPVRTVEELTRRLSVGTLQQDTTVHVAAGAITSAKLDVDGGGHTVTLRGTMALVVNTTVSVWTALSHATPEGCLLEAAGIADWTPLAGARVRFLDGDAAGVTTWIGTVNPHGAGVDVARVGPPAAITVGDAAPTLPVPAPADNISVELPATGIEVLEFTCRDRTSNLIVEDMELDLAYITVAAYDAWYAGVKTVVRGCLVSGGYQEPNGIVPLTQLTEKTMILVEGCRSSVVEGDWIHGPTWLTGCTVVSLWVTGSGLSRADYVLTGQIYVGTEDSSESASATLKDTQCFTSGMIVRGAANIYASSLSGDTSGQYGLVVSGNNVHFTWDPAGTMNLMGTVGAVQTPTCNIVGWGNVLYDSDEQQGTAFLNAGAAVVAARNANVRGVNISRQTAAGAVGDLSAPSPSRAADQFEIASASATDTSSVDWHIPKAVGLDVLIAPDASLVYPR
jgi:hypothetical protein